MKELNNIEKIKELFLKLDAREKILFSNFYNECVEKELTERREISGEIELRLVNLGTNSCLNAQIVNARSSMQDMYGPGAQDNTKYPIPVRYNGKTVGTMNKDGSVSFDASFDTSQLFVEQTFLASSRSLGEASINGKVQKVEGIEVEMQEADKEMVFDFSIDEIVELPYKELGIIKEINTETIDYRLLPSFENFSSVMNFPYKVKIIHGNSNSVGEIRYFKKSQLKHVTLTKLL